ncbi:MAG: DUF87 domain-containing protein [Candidatus Obscuribacterales bacterium]|nr:DUF87 domain-containing protein [Candidatus Obscuribacterales bacterium]
MQDYEQLGFFYLGKKFDQENKRRTDEPLLYDSADLVTHAVCLGMTGSGKTGLAIDLLEEAAIDNIPVIAIDPKGDLANLLLTFPDLSPQSFQPWIDPALCARNKISLAEQATKEAATWEAGLKEWGQSAERIKLYQSAAEKSLYTPGSSAGISLSILQSLACPDKEILQDPDLLREQILGTVTGLLTLLGIEADPLKSKEHIFLASLINKEWQQEKDLTFNTLIEKIQNPSESMIGALPLETFFPEKERFELVIAINNLLSSPGFSAWLSGVELDIDKLFHNQEGKPKLSIISIAHLSDQERMFFVTIFLTRLLGWMRKQSGTGSLRAIFYMDEIFGYFPPVANPPSKGPLLTLLKQARAFGLGIVLASQNPMDLDYKALGNTGTWFIGKLQTERDMERVLDGLAGASQDKAFSRSYYEKAISGLQKRMFLMRNIHENEAVIFETRWALSYLAGPLSRQQIKLLAKEEAMPAPKAEVQMNDVETTQKRPLLPPDIPQKFLKANEQKRFVYLPTVAATAKIHFSNSKANIDCQNTYSFIVPILDNQSSPNWDEACPAKFNSDSLSNSPEPEGDFANSSALPSDYRKFQTWSKSFVTWLYNKQSLTLFRCPLSGRYSQAGESEINFRVRLAHESREERQRILEELRDKYALKVATLEERLRKATQNLELATSQARDLELKSALDIGSSLLGAFVSRRLASRANINKAGSAARSIGMVQKQKQKIDHAQEDVSALQEKIIQLNSELESELLSLKTSLNPANQTLESLIIKAKKTNIVLQDFVLCWKPQEWA